MNSQQTPVPHRLSPLTVVVVTKNLSSNALARVHSLWLLAQALGWKLLVVGPAATGSLWFPLREHTFARDCYTISGSRDDTLSAIVAQADVIVAFKALPSSLRLARRAARIASKPLCVDLDDPDVEKSLDLRERQRSPRALVRWALDQIPLRLARRATLRLPVMTSNPTLAQAYAGTVVPHARPPGTAGAPHISTRPVVAFVGTIRRHKGVEMLRRTIARLSDHGFRLVVTADPPADAWPWETWVGATTLDAGLEIVRNSDVVAVPLLDRGYGSAQLPIKLIDAMLASRAVVAADLPTIRWALGESGVLHRPGDEDGLVAALERLKEPRLRTDLGSAARSRALARFVPNVVAPAFERFVTGTVLRGLQER